MNYNPYQFGAFQSAQQRFSPAPTNYAPQIATPQMPPQAAPQGMLVRPVTSVQEASVFQIPFDGSTSWFYDTSGDKLYSKTFDFGTGTAPIVTYVREQPAPSVQYVTVEAMESLMEEINNLKDEMDALKRRKGKKNEPDVPDE